jgi:hypothetical protein
VVNVVTVINFVNIESHDGVILILSRAHAQQGVEQLVRLSVVVVICTKTAGFGDPA